MAPLQEFTWKGAVKIELPSHFVFTCIIRNGGDVTHRAKYITLCSAMHAVYTHARKAMKWCAKRYVAVMH